MRRYRIEVGGEVWDAQGDPNALDIELDLPVSAMDAPGGNAFVRIWGIPMQTLLGAKKYNQKPIKVFGGMQKGLPLANPNQYGLLVQGSVFPCVGNWVGVDQTLDFFIAAPFGSPTSVGAANLTHDWKAKQPLSTAIKNTLQKAFKGYTINVNISPRLVLSYDAPGIYQSIVQYAESMLSVSRTIINDAGYLGVRFATYGNTINVYDGTQNQTGPKTVNAWDLIGQPIWTGPNTVQVKTVMRGDFMVGDQMTLPQTLATLTAGSAPQVQGSSASNIIQGTFMIQRIHHTGRFRQPSWQDWCTTFDLVQQHSSGN